MQTDRKSRFIEMIGRLYTRGGAYQGNRDLLSVPSVARCSRHPCRLSDPRTRSYPLILSDLDNLCHLSLQPGRVARSHHPNLYRLFHREFHLFRSVLYQTRIITIFSNLYSNDILLFYILYYYARSIRVCFNRYRKFFSIYQGIQVLPSALWGRVVLVSQRLLFRLSHPVNRGILCLLVGHRDPENQEDP